MMTVNATTLSKGGADEATPTTNAGHTTSPCSIC